MVTWCGRWNSLVSIRKVFRFTSCVPILLVLCRKYSFIPFEGSSYWFILYILDLKVES